jgi:hypothetical protein
MKADDLGFDESRLARAPPQCSAPQPARLGLKSQLGCFPDLWSKAGTSDQDLTSVSLSINGDDGSYHVKS